MTYSDLTKADFLYAEWEKVIDESDEKDCNTYSSRFGARRRDLEQAGNIKDALIFALLQDITSLHLKLDSPEEPFGPMRTWHDRRTAVVGDFDESQLALLNQVVAQIKDAELRARIADVLWLRKRDYRLAELAVSSYLESAALLEDPEGWVATADRIERAFQLATMLGRNGKPFSQVSGHIEGVLARYNGEDPLYLSARLMEFLLERRVGNPAENAVRAEKLAIRAESSCDWDRAREYWSMKAKWHKMAGEDNLARNARILEAETNVRQADEIASAEHPNYHLVSFHIHSAIAAYRRVGNADERINELHQRLLSSQQESAAQLIPHSSKTDITELVAQALGQVKGVGLHEGLVKLAIIANSPSVDAIRAQAEEHRDRFLGQRLFPHVFLNAMGRVIARQSNDPEESLMADMHKNASFARLIIVQGLIEPVRQQIMLEHYTRVNDLLPFLHHNPFVQQGREMIIARGLHSGLSGDFLTAVHFLIPQIEASIRYILAQLKVITSGLDDEGIQDEFNVNRLLSASEFTDSLANVLGADFVFDLRGLLVERFGANLRNDMAHGLIDHDAFYSISGCYLWWLGLRFYLWPKISSAESAQAEPNNK